MKPTCAPHDICPGGIGFRHPQDDPAVALGGDGLGGAQVAQGLGDGGVVDPGGSGEVGDADRAGGLDAGEDGDPTRLAEGGDGLADALAVDDAVAGAVRDWPEILDKP